MKRLLLVLVMLLATVATVSAQDDMTGSPVFELTVAEVTDMENFVGVTSAITEMEGYVGSLEYFVIFSAVPEVTEDQMIFIAVTEWASEDAYNAAADMMMPDDAPYTVIYNIPLEPFAKDEAISLADFPGPGEILEIAIRDISGYEDPFDFVRTVFGFTEALGELDGVLREYSWMSLDGTYFVGMTRYASADAFGAVAQNETLMMMPNTQYAFMTYPAEANMFGTLPE